MQGLQKARTHQQKSDQPIRLLFSPNYIDVSNFNDVCSHYAQIKGADYDTVVIVESQPGSAEKKLPMPSNKAFETSFGSVPANDRLRNDFADEDDDFFVNDEAFDENSSFYDHLMMLQCVLNDFSVLSLQITEENSFIVKELAFALEEILASKNALVICCANLKASHGEEFDRALSLSEREDLTGLMNYLNSGESTVEGLGAFITGLIVANRWKLKINLSKPENRNNSNNLLFGYAELQSQPIFG